MADTKDQQHTENHQSEQLGLGFQNPSSPNHHHFQPSDYHDDEPQTLADEVLIGGELDVKTSDQEEVTDKEIIDAFRDLVLREIIVANTLEDSQKSGGEVEQLYPAVVVEENKEPKWSSADKGREIENVEGNESVQVDKNVEGNNVVRDLALRDITKDGVNEQVHDEGFMEYKEFDEGKCETELDVYPVVVEGNVEETKEVKGSGTDDKVVSRWSEFENVEGNESVEVSKNVEGNDEIRDLALREIKGELNDGGHEFENGGTNDEIDEGKWEREVDVYPVVVERNVEENKEMKESSIDDKIISRWSEIENVEGNESVGVKVDDEERAIDYYENNFDWPEDGKVDHRPFEVEDQRIFGDYEHERFKEELFDEEGNGYVDGDFVGFKDDKYRRYRYPLRLDAEDCSFYMKTGSCKFGSNCKFNHPARGNLTTKDAFKQKEGNSDRQRRPDCKYFLTSEGCKYGNACKFNHSRGKTMVAPISEFNFLGLPIRVGEKECPYYMRNGSCKYGSNCRFNHPDPTTPAAVGGGDPLSGYGDSSALGGSHDAIFNHSSAGTFDKTAPFVPIMYPPTPDTRPSQKWDAYQAPTYPTSEKSLPTPPAFAMNLPAVDANFFPHRQEQGLVGEFPERPGQPECSYFMRTGDCKYRSGCKFHHPKNRTRRTSSYTVSDQAFPLRPDQKNVCTHYSRYGSCKFGSACKYDHPPTYGSSASSAGARPGQHPYGNSASADGDWRMETLVQQSV